MRIGEREIDNDGVIIGGSAHWNPSRPDGEIGEPTEVICAIKYAFWALAIK